MKRICLSAIAALIVATSAVAAPGQKKNAERSFEAYLTGYSYWDNTPPGSAAIARPVVHRQAGGKGTYRDPITLAVGHVKRGRAHSMDYPAGTRFYLPLLRKYAIVEDLCGDGDRPQDGPCHSGKDGRPWIDIYVDGSRAGKKTSHDCMYKITGMQQVMINPRSDYPVVRGPITESGCKTFK